MKQVKGPRLPSLHRQSSKKLMKKNEELPRFIVQQKMLRSFKQHPKKIQQVKAHNFLNQTMTLGSPSVISNISECIKKQYGKIFDDSKQFSQQNLIKNNFSKHFVPHKQNIPTKSLHLGSLTQNSSMYQPDKKHSFERIEILNLAQWIDQKLEQFNSKTCISIAQIIDYKQHILNYGLGKIIDSVSKKCKQQGDLLRILWQNSFRIFEKVLETVSSSICQNQKSHLFEQKQTKKIFDTNLAFLQAQNKKLNTQLNDIYQKMKKIVIWNKRLRKQKKQSNIQKKISQYRIQTYSRALEQTVDMFLRAVPQPSTVNFSKKIIAKLAIQKRRKKKGFQMDQVEQDFQIQAKQLVVAWLKRNGLNQYQTEQIDHMIYLTNDQKLQLTIMDDEDKINQVDIFQYFKLLDIGVQATQPMNDVSSQYDKDYKPGTTCCGAMTDAIFMINFQVQVGTDGLSQKSQTKKKKVSNSDKNNSKIVRRNDNKKKSLSKLSQKSEKVKDKTSVKKVNDNQDSKVNSSEQNSEKPNNKTSFIKLKDNPDGKASSQEQKNSTFSKHVTRTNTDGSIKKYSKKGQDKQNCFISKEWRNQTLEDDKDRFNDKDFTIISQKQSEQINFDSDEQNRNSLSQKPLASISRLNGGQSRVQKAELSRYQHDQLTHGGLVSIKVFTQNGTHQQSMGGALSENNLKKLWQAIHDKKLIQYEEKDQRLSVNFIRADRGAYSMKKLERKLFNQVYRQGGINSKSKDKQRENLFQSVVRSRSFYKKRKVMFANADDLQESKQIKSNLHKGYLNYKSHRNRTIIELSQEQEQRVGQISKKMAIPSNLAKSKTLATSKQTFKLIYETCRRTKRQPPKNQQYFNASLITITKNVSALIQDYLRQIRRQKQGIQNDCYKTYYPLHTILMDKMNHKYGLKDISQKKLKDFIQKVLTFAPVSQKISLYSLLFGMDEEGVGADELLIYLKCLVYLEKKQLINSSIHIIKQTNVLQKVITDPQIVQQNLERILKFFFDSQGLQITKKQVFQHIQNNQKYLSIEKISEIIIRCLLRRKQLFRKDCSLIYKMLLRGNNIFQNLYKLLKVYNDYRYVQEKQSCCKNDKGSHMSRQVNIPSMLKQFIKRSDVIDEIYGKSISFDRFLTAFMVTEFPKFNQLLKIFNYVIQIFDSKCIELNALKKVVIKTPKQSLRIYCAENVKFLQKIQNKWSVKSDQKPQQQFWQWSVTKAVTENVQSNMKGILGKIGIINNQIQNFLFSIQNKLQPSISNVKQ